MIEEHSLARRITRVRERIAAACQRAGRDPAEITVIAVTKTIAPDVIARAYDLGLHVFGENRVQEAQPKIPVLPGARWELIGPLQRNKVRVALGLFARIQTVADFQLAETIERIAAERGQIVPVLMQVNVAEESTKHGVAPAEARHLATLIESLPHLRPEGLMTVAPIAADPETVRPVFAQLRRLRTTLRSLAPDHWQDLSMGMTDDFGIAIEEGATHIRIGRAIFAERRRD